MVVDKSTETQDKNTWQEFWNMYNKSNRTHHASDFMRNPVGLFYLWDAFYINIQNKFELHLPDTDDLFLELTA